jgi:hypothetical protein
VNVDIRDRHLKNLMTHTHNFRLDSVDMEEGSPFKPEKTLLIAGSSKSLLLDMSSISDLLVS